jgi:hypothetical protein
MIETNNLKNNQQTIKNSGVRIKLRKRRETISYLVLRVLLSNRLVSSLKTIYTIKFLMSD